MNISINSSYNTLESYILGVEAWNSMFSYAAFTLTTITFNNSYVAWNADQSTLDLHNFYTDYVKSNVIQNMTDLLEKDMGNSSKFMKELFTTTDFCETEMMPTFPWCKTYLNGAVNTGIIEILKSVRNHMIDWVALWQDRRETRAGIISVLNSTKSVDVLPTLNKLMAKIYYAIVIPATDGMFAEFANN